VCFHDDRYHGWPEWPPSPARLFQALVAGTAKGGTLPQNYRDALFWLEQLDPPIIVAPPVRAGRAFRNYVPNNDIDAVGGDPNRIAEIRAPKLIRPLLFDACTPLLYAWHFAHGEEYGETICAMAEWLYQLGRGVDMAWAWGEIIDSARLDSRLRERVGTLYRPCKGGGGRPLLCPQRGSLKSLEIRFAETQKRFSAVISGRQVRRLFSQAPSPRFATVAYGSRPQRFMFELREITGESSFAPWPLVQVSQLVEKLRDGAAQRLKDALPEDVAIIERVFIGRDAKDADKPTRIRIIPLPSIGSVHVVRSIRRLLIEVPPNCPLPGEDVAWAFSGLDVIYPETGEVKAALIRSHEDRMLRYYGIDNNSSAGYRIWRTVTAAVLPNKAGRRRIDPRRLQQEMAASRNSATTEFKEAKPSHERMQEEGRAVAAVIHALRHAEVSVRTEAIRVQREPFEDRGARAETFADSKRFAKERLWHVEIVVAEPVRGPLVIGDGRYLGLGLMAPLRYASRDAATFAISAQANIAVVDSTALVHATRRALMALSREDNGHIPRIFSGHEADGKPAASGRQEHVFLAADDRDGDGLIDRLIIAAPWACDHSGDPPAWRDRALFDRVVSILRKVRAGRLGVITLAGPAVLADGDPLIGPARVWRSRTLYYATRHASRRKDPATALVRDVVTECERRSLPMPEVEILNFSAMSNGGGLAARARLRFASAIRGPLLLGRNSHKGGGVFVIEE
jgi:CRISPR-associated protein Csb2